MKLFAKAVPALLGCAALCLSIGQVSAQTPPTVAQAAAANPNPVAGTSDTVTVLGADAQGEASLIYTWSATSKPLGAADPVFYPNGGGPFDSNGSNPAKNSTAIYNMAGDYTLQVVIQNMTGLTATSTVPVTVSPVLSQITVMPSIRAVITNASYAFTATTLDQFGNSLAVQPALAWSVSAGANGGGVNGATIDNTGLFTAGAAPGGPYTVQAQASGQSGTASVFVASSNEFPQVTLSSPTDGQVFTQGGAAGPGGPGGMAITLIATIVDPNGVVTNVEFFENGVLLGPSQGLDIFDQPYYTWNNPDLGTYVLLARTEDSDGGTVDSATVTVTVVATATPPTISQAAAANPNPVTTGTTNNLSVLGADALGEANLTYTWSAAFGANGGVQPLFSPNGNNAAKNSIATYLKAGNYSLQVVIQNGASLTVTSTVSVTVQSVAASQLAITPANRLVVTNTTQAFSASAVDQFGYPLGSLPGVVWSVTGGGIIDNTGLFTAGSAPGGPFNVQAQAAGFTGTTLVMVESPNQFPQVSMASPANGQVYLKAHTNVILSANVVDPVGSVTNVAFLGTPNPYNANAGPNQFYQLEGNALAPPYTCIWTNPTASVYTLIARAYNNDGTTVDSDYVTFTVNSNQPPQVTLTSPTNILIFKAGVNNIYTLTASVVDPDNTVTNVEFVELNTGTVVPQPPVPPYSTTCTNTELGESLWVARAQEYDGSSVDSPWATVIVEPVQILSVPHYSSYQAARVKIYLDFTGGYVPYWAGPANLGDGSVTKGGVYIPPYDFDGDPTTFSAAELEDIHQMWLRAAEAFSPFNVDVTTINPGEEHFVSPNDCVKVVIGGSGTWINLSGVVGNTNSVEEGVAFVSSEGHLGGYTAAGFPDASTCYVFSERKRQLWDEGPTEAFRQAEVSFMGWLIAHEVGHQFGLHHEHGWDLLDSGNGWATGISTSSTEYGYGTWEYLTNEDQLIEDLKSPIMGESGAGSRTIWGVATSTFPPSEAQAVATTDFPPTQDDVAYIASTNGYPNNGFGFRPPDHGNSIGTADPLIVVSNVISGNGVIQTLDDQDFFSFTTPGGQISLTISPPLFGHGIRTGSYMYGSYDADWGMLDVKAELFASDGTRLFLADHEQTFASEDPTETICTNLPAGTYYLAVESQGNYGDIGQYNITGTLVLPSSPTITGSTLNASGQFAFQFIGDANAGYSVLTSTNVACPLTNWQVLGQATFFNGVFQFTDLSASNSPARFYQVRSP